MSPICPAISPPQSTYHTPLPVQYTCLVGFLCGCLSVGMELAARQHKRRVRQQGLVQTTTGCFLFALYLLEIMQVFKNDNFQE